jgi:2-keto-4-pentenoate hydratase/2-oxohepta-3-ene-1,7-dioic acid hydratase in catechol pathway
MIYGPLKLIKYFSSFTPLSPGDVIVSGMGVGLAAQSRPC